MEPLEKKDIQHWEPIKEQLVALLKGIPPTKQAIKETLIAISEISRSDSQDPFKPSDLNVLDVLIDSETKLTTKLSTKLIPFIAHQAIQFPDLFPEGIP